MLNTKIDLRRKLQKNKQNKSKSAGCGMSAMQHILITVIIYAAEHR